MTLFTIVPSISRIGVLLCPYSIVDYEPDASSHQYSIKIIDPLLNYVFLDYFPLTVRQSLTTVRLGVLLLIQ